MKRLATGDTTNSDELSIKEFLLAIIAWLGYLASKWLLILLFFIAGAVCGIFYVKNKKPVYTATTTFVLEDANGGGFSQYSGIANLMGIDIGGGGGGIFQGENLFGLYKSRNMVQKALLSEVVYKGKKQLLVDSYIHIHKLAKEWERPDLQNIDFILRNGKPFTRLQDSVLAGIVDDINKGYLNVSKADPKLSIIKVDVKAQDEFFAKIFAEQIVKTVNDFYIQTKTKKFLQNLSILQHQTDSVKNVLNGAIYQTVAVADATPNLNPTRQVLRAPAQKSQFSVEANKAILMQLVQNLELAKISLRKETPLIQVLDQPILPLPVTAWTINKGIILFGFLGVFIFIAIASALYIFKKLLS